MNLPLNQVVLGEALTTLRSWPDHCVDCIITSPPYFRQRRYAAGRQQLGNEDTVSEFVDNLANLCDELARVLTATGSLVLNIGDSYSRHRRFGAARKCLCLAPERLAITLAERGWIVRNSIVWCKPNGMPSSVTDRFANKHERIFLLTRLPHAFFDLDSVRVPHLTKPKPLTPRTKHAKANSAVKYGLTRPTWAGPEGGDNAGLIKARIAGRPGHPAGKNPGDWWSIPTAGFRGPHPAVYPVRLVERPLRACCPERVCTACTTPWRRMGAELRQRCQCDALARRGRVLDPFIGSGTTAIVAEQHGRDWLGIELSPTYRKQAINRITEARMRLTGSDPAPSNR